MQKITKADEIRDMINKIADIRDNLDQIYDTLQEKEQTSLQRGIDQLNLCMKRMGKRLLQERMREAWTP